MKVRVVEEFYDRTDNLALKAPGEELEVTKERAYILIEHGLAELIPEPVKLKEKTKKA